MSLKTGLNIQHAILHQPFSLSSSNIACCHQVALSVIRSVILSVCVQDYCKSNQPISLKLGVVIVPTSQKNLLTFGGDPIPATNSGSLFTSLTIAVAE